MIHQISNRIRITVVKSPFTAYNYYLHEAGPQIQSSQSLKLATLYQFASILDGVFRQTAGVIVIFLQFFVFVTTLLYFLFIPLVDDGVIQVRVSAGTLADDSHEVELGSLIISTIELQDNSQSALPRKGWMHERGSNESAYIPCGQERGQIW